MQDEFLIHKSVTTTFEVGKQDGHLVDVQAHFNDEELAHEYVRLLQEESKKYVEVVADLQTENAKLNNLIKEICSKQGLTNLLAENAHLKTLMQDLRNATDSQMQQSLLDLREENEKLKNRLFEVREYTGSCKDSCLHCQVVHNAVKGQECQPTQ